MERIRIAIIGGGPGGLMTAYLLGKRSTQPMAITLFEASERLGGKVKTAEFRTTPVRYEAGAAELYDYSQLGPDPLRELVHELGLTTREMSGDAVVMNERVLKTYEDIQAVFGDATCRALRGFEWRGRSSISPAEYYESDWAHDNENRLSKISFAALLDEVRDENARRYIEVAVHSDVATEPEKTNGMYGLQNYLMNLPQYMRLYTIDGGIERLTEALAERIHEYVDVRLRQPVARVERTEDGTYLVSSHVDDAVVHDEFDIVVVALPNNWIPLVDWRGESLQRAMRQHSAHYACPAHYLRVSVLFDRPFWRSEISGSYFMSDAFGGCCVYDESSRNGDDSYGVLGWLLGGDAALTMANFDDATLVAKVLDSLPECLRHGKEAFVEGRVHRWLGAVNGLPGGKTLREPDARHVPDPEGHPELFVVGDYLFDSTLNGVLDSADTVAEWIVEDMSAWNDDEASGVRPTPVPSSTTRHVSGNADSDSMVDGIGRQRVV